MARLLYLFDPLKQGREVASGWNHRRDLVLVPKPKSRRFLARVLRTA